MCAFDTQRRLFIYYFVTKVFNVWRFTHWDELSDKLHARLSSFREEIFRFKGSWQEFERLINEGLKELYETASEDEKQFVLELHKQTREYFKGLLNIVPFHVRVLDALSGKPLDDAKVEYNGHIFIVKRDGYESFTGLIEDNIVKLSPAPVDILVRVILMDELGDIGPVPDALVVAKPISYTGEAIEALTNECGEAMLKLFFNQEYEVAVSHEDSVCNKLITVTKFYEEVELKVQTREYRRLKVNVIPEVTSLVDFISNAGRPELFITLYDLDGNLLTRGYTGKEVQLVKFVKPGSQMIVNIYPIDSRGQYVGEWHKVLKEYITSKGEDLIVNIEKQEINVRVPFPLQVSRQGIGERERLSIRLRDLSIFQDIKHLVRMYPCEEKKPEKTDVSFCDYLEWRDENKAMALFGRDYDGKVLKLYKHQYEALMKLEEAGQERVCLILASGMASGKTEVAVLYLLKFFRRADFGCGGRVLIVYPTRELLRNQYSRWRMYFNGAYDLGYLPTRVEVAMLYGELPQTRREQEAKKLKRAPCVVLTTASMLFYWANRLDKELNAVPSIILLDEAHFYSAFDLTLIMELLRFILNRYGGVSKLLMFSATIGGLREFAKKVEGCLKNIKVVGLKGESLQGPKTVYLIDLSSEINEGKQEAIINQILREYSKRGFYDKTIIFAMDRNEAESLYRRLDSTFRRIACLHLGDMDMWERKKSAKDFMTGRKRVIISVKTLEVGIDIGDASRVIHLNLPSTLNEFMQREGRVGRRGQECESIVILKDKSDVKRINKWIEKLVTSQPRPDFRELLSKLVFKDDCEAAKQIRRKYEKFPEYIEWETFKFPCKVYGSLTSFPVELNGKKVNKRVWVRDIIFRYLPYSIRTIRGKRCIVKEITLTQTKKRGKQTIVMEDLERSSLIPPALKTVHKTTSHVDTIIRSLEELTASPYKTIIVEYDPWAVNYVARKEKEILDENSGRYLKIPVYYVIGRFPVSDDVRDVLRRRSRDFTRGFKLVVNVPSEVADTFRQFLYGKELELIQSLLKVALDEYIHLAVHAILNQVVEKTGWNPKEIDHYVSSTVNLDEEAKQKLKELLSEPVNEDDKCRRLIESLLPKLSITVVIGNKADLLMGFNWNDVQIKDLEELGKTDFEAELIYPWCPVKPILLHEDLADPNGKARKVIVNLAGLILERVRDAAGKVKAY